MGTSIYGSYDHLVIEVTGVDRLRSRTRRLRVPIDLIAGVCAAPSGRWSRAWTNVIAEVGSLRHPAVVIETVGGGTYAVHVPDADQISADLLRCGVVAQRDARTERARRHAGAAARS